MNNRSFVDNTTSPPPPRATPRVSVCNTSAADDIKSDASGVSVIENLNCENIQFREDNTIPKNDYIMRKSRKVRLGVVAVQILNPVNNQSTCVYAFQDAGSQLTLLRRSVVKEIGLKGVPIIQLCRGMNSTVERSMEIVNLRIRGFKETDTFDIQEVRLTDVVPELYHSLPNDFDIDSHENFTDITYPIINRDCCDMLIGADNMSLH